MTFAHCTETVLDLMRIIYGSSTGQSIQYAHTFALIHTISNVKYKREKFE